VTVKFHGSIGIIGAGFSGTMLAAHLVEQSATPIKVLLFDRAAAFGSGVAYSTPNAKHLLNVRAANMSAYESDPDHFIRWLERTSAASVTTTSGSDFVSRGICSDFVSRGIYGQYLRETLAACLKTHPGSSVTVVGAEVTELQVGQQFVELRSVDGHHSVDYAVLCIGNFPPALPVALQSKAASSIRYIPNPWGGGRHWSISDRGMR
jgi:uncharacterized NAD(P)/FAD-binding protein YdhS